MPSSAARSALSTEVRDFEEEKSLDLRQRRPRGCSRAGRLWHDYLFCRPHPSPQRAEQPCHDRNPEPQRLYQGRTADRRRLLRHPQRPHRPARYVLCLWIFGGALPISIQSMPEEQEGAVYGFGRRQSGHGQLPVREDHRHRLRPEWSFRQHIRYPQWNLRLRGQPGRPTS